MVMTGFFMLSGFCNYSFNYKKDLSEFTNLKVFWIKRVAGIIPLYYFAGIVYIILKGKESLLQNIMLAPMELLGLQIIYPNTFYLTHNDGTWFISGILICYWIFPFVLELIKKISVKVKVILIIVLMTILLYSPLVVAAFSLGTIYSNPFLRSFEFIIGMILASFKDSILESPIGKFISSYIAAILETVILIAGVQVIWSLGIGRGNYMLYSWIGLPLFSLLLITFSSIKIKDNFIIQYLSTVSYSFFLVQLFIWVIMQKIVNMVRIDNNIFRIISSFIVCFIIASLMYELVEKPSKKFLYRKVLRL